MTETTSRSIARKLAIAAKACGYVQKDGTNNFHRYKFASAANILGHVNDALCEAGLAVVDTLPEIVLDGVDIHRPGAPPPSARWEGPAPRRSRRVKR